MKHVGKAAADALRGIKGKPASVEQAAVSAERMAHLVEVSGNAYRIATYHPVSQWAAEIAYCEAAIREDVRETLAHTYRTRQQDEAFAAAVEAGRAAEITIRKEGKI